MLRSSYATVFVALLVASCAPSAARATQAASEKLRIDVVAKVEGPSSIVLETGESVMLAGVDRIRGGTEAQTADLARQSTKALEKLVERERVWLEFDTARTDGQGNTIAYVFRQRDGLLVNGEIIRLGYAKAFLGGEYRHKPLFVKLDTEARAAYAGHWSLARQAPAPKPAPVVAKPVEVPNDVDVAAMDGTGYVRAAPAAESGETSVPSGESQKPRLKSLRHIRHVEMQERDAVRRP